MVYIQDTTQSFTISLTALLEGRGIIALIEVYNDTTGDDYIWSLDYGWETDLPEATEADSIKIYAEVLNDGATTDTLFGEFVSAEVSPVGPSLLEIPGVDVGFTALPEWSFTMPPNAVNITINAGHVE